MDDTSIIHQIMCTFIETVNKFQIKLILGDLMDISSIQNRKQIV